MDASCLNIVRVVVNVAVRMTDYLRMPFSRHALSGSEAYPDKTLLQNTYICAASKLRSTVSYNLLCSLQSGSLLSKGAYYLSKKDLVVLPLPGCENDARGPLVTVSVHPYSPHMRLVEPCFHHPVNVQKLAESNTRCLSLRYKAQSC
jgi:hypothetical protein